MQVKDRREDNRRNHEALRAARSVVRDLRRVSRIPRRLEPGTVVWAHVPYREGGGEKLRPAVVSQTGDGGARLWKVTSSATRLHHPFHVEITDLGPAGLTRPCAIDVREPVAVDRLDIVSIAGKLSADDYLRLRVGSCLWELASDPGVAA